MTFTRTCNGKDIHKHATFLQKKKKRTTKNQAKLKNNGQYRIGKGSTDHNKYNMGTMKLIADILAGLQLTWDSI